MVLGEPWFAWEKEEGETALAESDPVYDLTAIDIRFLLWMGLGSVGMDCQDDARGRRIPLIAECEGQWQRSIRHVPLS